MTAVHRRLALILVIAAALLAAVGTGSARADGDPASDVLFYQNYFLPYSPPTSPAVEAQLKATTRAARKEGYPIKVAVIATANDLGSIPEFLNDPAGYAHFLSSELRMFYKRGVLVVVTPSGVGAEAHGVPFHPGALKSVRIADPTSSDALVRAGIDAATKLARASGYNLSDAMTAPRAASTATTGGGGSSGGSSWIVIAIAIVIAGAGVLVAMLVVIALRRRRRRA